MVNCLVCGNIAKRKFCSRSCAGKSASARNNINGVMVKNNSDPEYQHKCTLGIRARWEDDQFKIKRSSEISAVAKRLMSDHRIKTRILSVARDGLRKKWLDNSYRKKMSAVGIVTANKLITSNSLFNSRNYGRFNYNGIFMRSSWEVKFAQMCDERGIKWQYEPKSMTLKSGHNYIPDFHLPTNNLWVEVKPKVFHQDAYSKISNLTLPVKVRVLDKSDFMDFLEAV